MDYGIQLATSAHHWKIVKRAEEMGFTHAWFYDTQLLNADVFVAMAAAAVNTAKIKLCTGVLIPSNRIAPVAASALASLNALAPGRIMFGVGTGFTGRRTMGLPAITLARLEEYIRVVGALLKGETTNWSEEGGTHKIRFLNPEMKFINIDDPIPVHISAFGPKGRALAAKNGVWIVQERIPIRREVFPYIAQKGRVDYRDMLVDFAPYLFRGKLCGFLTRLSSTGLANVTSGGGQVPAFRVSPKSTSPN